MIIESSCRALSCCYHLEQNKSGGERSASHFRSPSWRDCWFSALVKYCTIPCIYKSVFCGNAIQWIRLISDPPVSCTIAKRWLMSDCKLYLPCGLGFNKFGSKGAPRIALTFHHPIECLDSPLWTIPQSDDSHTESTNQIKCLFTDFTVSQKRASEIQSAKCQTKAKWRLSFGLVLRFHCPCKCSGHGNFAFTQVRVALMINELTRNVKVVCKLSWDCYLSMCKSKNKPETYCRAPFSAWKLD